MDEISFVFKKNWLDSIKKLPDDVQEKIIAELVRFGCGVPLKHRDDVVVSSIVESRISEIGYSKEKYQQTLAMSQRAGRKKLVDDRAIWSLAQEGKKSAEIAEILGLSKSAVDHSDGWRNRRNRLEFDCAW